MDDQKTQRISYFGKTWPGENLGAFKLELPKPTEWEQLLLQLGLNDAQALKAVNCDGEAGEQLCRFVLSSLSHSYVPEAVVTAVRRRRKEKRLAIAFSIQSAAIHSDAVAITSAKQV
ncbi:MAG TPA: hypothetical protein VIY99_17025 [Terracidiphilus sp.]